MHHTFRAVRPLVSLTCCALIAGCGGEVPRSGPSQRDLNDLDFHTCDDTYAPQEISWADPLASTGERPADLLARLSDTRSELTFTRDQLAQHPWLHDARLWTAHLAPHPTRPPVQMAAVDGCPAMVVLPVAVRVEIGGGFIVLDDSGSDDDAAWAADLHGHDQPWRTRTTSVVRVLDHGEHLSLALEPGPSDLVSLPPAVQQLLSDTEAQWGRDPARLTASLWSDGVTTAGGLGAIHREPGGVVIVGSLAGGHAVRPPEAGGAAPAQCPPSEAVGADDPAFQVAQQWVDQATHASVALDWSRVGAPPEDWSAWSWALEPEILVHRVHVPDLAGGCEARTLAVGRGAIAPVDGSLSFDIELELTVNDAEVTGVLGVAGTSNWFHDAPRDTWLADAARQLDRPTDSGPGAMRWVLQDDAVRLLLRGAELWQPAALLADGVYDLD